MKKAPQKRFSGARLGYGLMSSGTDVSLKDIAELCDVFYIGGTKVGALFGEAVVFTRKNMPPHFTAVVKQHGALLAKGRMLGLQFDTLFTDDLYYRISRHAILMADRLREIFRKKGYEFYIEAPTNQILIVLENSKMEELRKKVAFSFWEKKRRNPHSRPFCHQLGHLRNRHRGTGRDIIRSGY